MPEAKEMRCASARGERSGGSGGRSDGRTADADCTAVAQAADEHDRIDAKPTAVLTAVLRVKRGT